MTRQLKEAIKRTNKDTQQGAEGLIHNLNSLQSRAGQQLPFSSINYGTNTSFEGRMITNAILDAELDGTGPLHKTSIFPCCIFQYSEKINGNPDSPNYDLFQKSLLCVAKRLYPNYCNTEWSVDIKGVKKDIENKRAALSKLSSTNKTKILEWCEANPKEAIMYRMKAVNDDIVIDEDVIVPIEIMSTMGCRTYNGYDMNFDFNYILKSIIKTGNPPKNYFYSGNQKDGRGNIAPATIILPTIAMETCGDIGHKSIKDFMKRLERYIEDCRDSLIERFILVANQSPLSATFMYYNNTMLGYIPEEGIISALKHGTLAIGQIGLAETLQILIGKDHTTSEGMALAKEIEQLFNTKAAEYKSEKRTILGQKMYLNFGVYYTPAENLCFTAMTKFKEKYGEIPKISDKKFFTNSMHVPVWIDVTPFKKMDIESQLTGYSNAGCITYVELDASASHNLKALEDVVYYAMNRDIPYLGINLPNDTCMSCGWAGEINDKCPMCGSTSIKRLRRVTGYLTEDYETSFNAGKIDEVEHRVHHLGKVTTV